MNNFCLNMKMEISKIMKIILSNFFFSILWYGKFDEFEREWERKKKKTSSSVHGKNTCFQISPLSLLAKDKNCSKKSLHLIDHDIT
jgi:hypothetical protein